jgi:aspartyl-tRNA(Asn)/glutamyl-tRNA(Gln) amidotransferase subunit A
MRDVTEEDAMIRRQSNRGPSGGPGPIDRRAVLQGLAAGVAFTAVDAALGRAGAILDAAARSEDELTWLPAWRIRELIARKEISPVEVLDHFLARIEQFNPTLKAFRHLDAVGAREQAKRAEEAVRRGDTPGPLHGIPISVKEHIAVAGMPVMGVRGGADLVAARDDLGVARLRASGAILVGTNTMMGTSAPAPGQYNWDAEARSPWDPARAPGWSSSGGAAAAAARLLPIAIGSDGGGSTRLPAPFPAS